MRWEHFEVWAEKAGKWEMVGAFLDFDVASAVARNYTYRMRLMHLVFEDGKKVQLASIPDPPLYLRKFARSSLSRLLLNSRHRGRLKTYFCRNERSHCLRRRGGGRCLVRA